MKIKKPMKRLFRGGVIIRFADKTYPNGDVYSGTLIDGLKHTRDGDMTYANGDYYRGPWVNDKREGADGKMKYKDGSVYIGNWVNDKREGEGKMTYRDGSVYIGNWVNDVINGEGQMTYSDGSFYFGNWLDGVKHGQGLFNYADDFESQYDGNWVNDKRQGRGSFDGPDGYQQGFWQEDIYLGPVRPTGLVLTDHDSVDDYVNIYEEIPLDNEDDDDDYANQEAFQIHVASSKINLDKYLQIINVNTNSDYGNITDYVRSKFVPLINRLFSNSQQSIDQLNAVLQKLNSAQYSREPKNINIIGKTVDFVLKQPDEFIEFYINAFIQDCYSAYQNGEMSCVAGIVERFYMIIGDAAYAMCPDENCNNPIYTELLTLFGKKIDKNELTQEWAEKYLESDEIKNMSKSERKQHYINFMKSKYKDLDMLDETTENLINREADNLDYVFESLQFGGKKRNKQTRKNRNQGKKLTKKRLGKLKFRVRTIKVKKGKRRVSRKRSNKKIERISKRS